jgi:hypothetical protein
MTRPDIDIQRRPSTRSSVEPDDVILIWLPKADDGECQDQPTVLILATK